MGAYEIIKQAILAKKPITAFYKGYQREMCPHVVGSTKGRSHALLYQFAGGSSSGLKPDGSPENWRCVFVDELTTVSMREGAWHTASNHSRPQRCVQHIDVQVKV